MANDEDSDGNKKSDSNDFLNVNGLAYNVGLNDPGLGSFEYSFFSDQSATGLTSAPNAIPAPIPDPPQQATQWSHNSTASISLPPNNVAPPPSRVSAVKPSEVTAESTTGYTHPALEHTSAQEAQAYYQPAVDYSLDVDEDAQYSIPEEEKQVDPALSRELQQMPFIKEAAAERESAPYDSMAGFSPEFDFVLALTRIFAKVDTDLDRRLSRHELEFAVRAGKFSGEEERVAIFILRHMDDMRREKMSRNTFFDNRGLSFDNIMGYHKLRESFPRSAFRNEKTARRNTPNMKYRRR